MQITAVYRKDSPAILAIIPQGKPTPSELNSPTTVASDFPNPDTLQAICSDSKGVHSVETFNIIEKQKLGSSARLLFLKVQFNSNGAVMFHCNIQDSCVNHSTTIKLLS